MTTPNADDGGLRVNWATVVRAALSGLVIIIPIVIFTEILDANVDNFSSSRWVFLPFVLILFAYAAAGYAGGRLAPWAPYTHGILASLGSFLTWLLFRVVERLVRGAHIGFGPRAVMTNAMFAAGLGLFGAAIAGRAPELLREDRDPPPEPA
ncbi:MAG: hypothetical protein JWL83_727 [Actinomycetia bacterium]|nr:hypothetical protein [Actinomycetes bacterium]